MTDLKLYNTRTRSLELFTPIHKDQVGLYTCGPTVYGTAHLGNLRTYLFEDILRRTLVLNGYNVKHVMNVTDVGHLTGDGDMGEDKMELSAKKEKKSAFEIAAEHEQEFFADLAKLNILTPDIVLHATKTIDLQIALIQKLEAKGVTYKTSDGIYFDTSKFPRYGELSGQKSGEKKAGARVEVNDEKKHLTDFALWKFSKSEDKRQMEWPSPWGVGFPGWHIECSAMSMHELGEQFDIHTGGIDHIAVHHENEIAQSEAATSKHPFVNIWMHGEFLVLPGKRMGKSEGNSITVQEVIDKGIDPLAFRYLCLQSHYRKPLSFTWESLNAAQAGLNKLWEELRKLELGKNISISDQVGSVEIWENDFFLAINSDLNSALALGILHDMLRDDKLTYQGKVDALKKFDQVLGLDLTPEAAAKHLVASEEITGHESMLSEYTKARAEKRYADSDKIRQEFSDLGLTVEDLPNGTSRLRKK